MIEDDINNLIESSDVIIDFTIPAATINLLKVMNDLKTPSFIEKFYKDRKSKNNAILLLIIFFVILFFFITILRMNIT